MTDPCCTAHFIFLNSLVTNFPSFVFFSPSFISKYITLSLSCQSWICFWLNATAAAKSLQPCPTLCGPINGSPLGSSVPGILQARILEWVAISFFNAWKWKVKVKSLSRAQLVATPWTAAYQAPPSMGFSGKSTGVGYIAFSVWLNSIFLFILDVVMYWWINTQDRRNKVAKLEIKPKVGAVRVAVF